MSVGTFAKTDVITLHPRATIKDAAKKMAENNVGLVVLVGERGEIAGVVSERDIVKAVAFETSPDSSVEIIATKSVLTVEYSEHVAKAVEIMRRHNVRHVVVTKGGRLYGVLSIRDIVHREEILGQLASYYEWTFEPGMTS